VLNHEKYILSFEDVENQHSAPSFKQESELNKLAEASSRLWNKANYQRHALFHK